MNIYDGAFLTSVKPYFKNLLNFIELPLSSILHTTHPFLEKTYNSKKLTNSKLCNRMASSTNRSSHQRFSSRKVVFENFAKFTGKHLYQSYFFNKVAGLRPATLLKNRPWHRYFPVNLAKFLRTPFLQNTSGQLLKKKGFFKLAPIKSVKTACVCIVFFFHYFKYYGQKIFFQEEWCFI